MLEVICNKAKTCKIQDCGMKNPHWHLGCKRCYFDSTAKCVATKETARTIIKGRMSRV